MASSTVEKYDIFPTYTQARYIESDAVINVIIGPMGEGKSARAGTKVLRADGSIDLIDNIRFGDQLMGDDSTPRNVLNVTHGYEEMYEIVPVKGASFVVNGCHILSLKRTRERNVRRGKEVVDRRAGELIDISLDVFLRQSTYFKELHKLYRVPVEFPFRPVDIDPYWLGLWLADGTSVSTEITTPDPEVVEYIGKYARHLGLDVSVYTRPSSGLASGYAIVTPTRGGINPLLSLLRDNNLLSNKHIPHRYKCNDREMRLALLAGLLDGDGWVNHGGFQIIQKREDLANDICFLARSLGLYAEVQPRYKRAQTQAEAGLYHHVMISGDCSVIPTRISRKQVSPRLQKKDPLVTGIKAINPIGKGEYVGVALDGNHRYLLSDFLVTHNTLASIMAIFAHAARGQVPLQAAVIRDTHENNKQSTVVAFNEFFMRYPALKYRWRNDFHDLFVECEPALHCRFFGCDDIAALTKLQGPEFGLIWLEEVCAFTDTHRTNAGINEDTFNAALVRCARQQQTKARLQLSSNPPDEDHYFYKRILSTPDGPMHPKTPLITKKVFNIPRGENTHLKEESRQATYAAYMHDEAALRRFFYGEYATKFPGKKVAKNFNRDTHVAREALNPLVGWVGWISFDSWGNPAAVMGQQGPQGQIIVLDVCQGGEDIRGLIQDEVLPRLMMPRWHDKCREWRHIGDCTMVNPDQSNVQTSAALVVEEAFPTPAGRNAVFEPGPSTWHYISNGLMQSLRHTIAGRMAVLIDPVHCKPLISALAGQWHYKKSRGGLTGHTPEKTAASHIGDALANALCVLAAWNPPKRRAKKPAHSQTQARRRASSYAS